MQVFYSSSSCMPSENHDAPLFTVVTMTLKPALKTKAQRTVRNT